MERHELEKAQCKILANLLEMAGTAFGGNICNDYEIENTPANRAIVEDAEKWNVSKSGDTPNELNLYKGKILIMDWFLFDYFAHLAKIGAGIEEE